MTFISTIEKEYRALLVAIRLMHYTCRTVVRVNAKVQASNASDQVKAASAALVAGTNDFCTLIEAFKQSLPGNH